MFLKNAKYYFEIALSLSLSHLCSDVLLQQPGTARLSHLLYVVKYEIVSYNSSESNA
jgi:hypothetical protein